MTRLIPAVVAVGFDLSLDGNTVRRVHVGQAVGIPERLHPGLLAAGFVVEPAAEAASSTPPNTEAQSVPASPPAMEPPAAPPPPVAPLPAEISGEPAPAPSADGSAAAATAPPPVAPAAGRLPEGWRDLTWFALQQLAAERTGEKPKSKADAIEALEAVEAKAAFAAHAAGAAAAA